MKLENLTEKILQFIRESRGLFYSDIARKFDISLYTARDHVKMLSKKGLVTVEDKGIAKLVLPTGDVIVKNKT